MSSTEVLCNKEVPVAVVMAMGDDDLSRFMLEHRHPDGSFQLPVDGWDRLSVVDRESLAAKLMQVH